MADSSDERVAHLFGLAPEEFTAARDRLAGQLRDAGDPSATEVRRLRRPTLGAWVVNQLARRHPEELRALLSAAEDLRAAQRAVIEGGSPADLREAGNERRRVIDRLLDRAQDILRQAGRPPDRGRLEGVERTLVAATTSEEAAADVARGKLSKELEPAGGFDSAGLAQAGAGVARARPIRRVERLRAEAEAAEGEAAEADDEAARTEKDARAAEGAAREARRAADRAADRAEKLRRRAEDLRRRAGEAADRSSP